jgi:hypothetical protein
MAASITGFSPNELKPQPGLVISRTENGGWEARHEIYAKVQDFDNISDQFTKGTLLSQLDDQVPSPFSDFLRIDTVSFSRVEGDLIAFNVVATGGGSAQFGTEDDLSQTAEPTYVLTGQLVDAPFSEHPKWKDLGDGDKKTLGLLLAEFYVYDITENKVLDPNLDYRNADDQLDAVDARAFAKLIQQGQTTYLRSAYTWNETTEGNEKLTSQQLNNLGKISTPRGNPPEPTGTRDWMLTSASQSQSGRLYRTSLEWTLSEDGGHDEFLYD